MVIKNENDFSTGGTFSNSSKDSTSSIISSVTPANKPLHPYTSNSNKNSNNNSPSSPFSIISPSGLNFEQQATQDSSNINQTSQINSSSPSYSSLKFISHKLSDAVKTNNNNTLSNQDSVNNNNTTTTARKNKTSQDQSNSNSFRVLKFSEMASTNSTNNDTAFQSSITMKMDSNSTSSVTNKFPTTVSNTISNTSSKPTLKEQSPSEMSTPPGKRIACVECRQQKVFFFSFVLYTKKNSTNNKYNISL